jgi:crotonobetainyl-CoA:carnitine CoA-transferase CaiB-like acyl-CoA transferase
MLANALKGLKVLDFTQIAAGPSCTMMLGDLGADVVKVEPPSGDLSRALHPHVAGESVNFMALNRNKRSVVFDLKNEAHAAAALKLAAQADVLVESFRPGVMDRLGLGYAELSRKFPRLIYCSVSAFGQEGPARDLPGVDGVLQAVTGLMSVTGHPGAPPCKVQIPLVDMATGSMACIAVLAALAGRERSGCGQHLDVSMFGSAVALQQMGYVNYLATGEVPAPSGSAAPYAAPNEAVRCKDGWLMLAAYHPARWAAMCKVMSLEPLMTDPRFSGAAGRIGHRAELVRLIEEQTMLRTRAEWIEVLSEVDVICGSINNYEEAVRSGPYVAADMSESLAHPVAGRLVMPRSPLRSAGETTAARRAPPVLGQHTQEVLGETGCGEGWLQAGAAVAPAIQSFA